MSGYLGSKSSRSSQRNFKAYGGKQVEGCVRIGNIWYWLSENKGEARELLGQYSVHHLGWGNGYCDWNGFSEEEKELLKTTLK